MRLKKNSLINPGLEAWSNYVARIYDKQDAPNIGFWYIGKAIDKTNLKESIRKRQRSPTTEILYKSFKRIRYNPGCE